MGEAAEWVVCSSCALKHRRREDGRCPRCQSTVGLGEPGTGPSGTVDARAHAARPKIAVPETDTGPRLGHRVAAAFLVVSALSGLVDLFIVRPSAADWLPVHTLVLATCLIDLTLSAFLFVGNRVATILAYVRVGLGVIVFSSLWIHYDVPKGAWLSVAFAGGLLVLLVGRAGTPRIVAGACVLAALTLFDWTLMVSASRGGPIYYRFVLEATVEPDPATELKGVRIPWAVQMPNDRWHPRKPELIDEDPLAGSAGSWLSNQRSPFDGWLTRVDFGAHVFGMSAANNAAWMVRMVSMDELTNNFIGGLALADFTGYHRLEQIDLTGPSFDEGRRILFELEARGWSMKGYTGLFIKTPFVVVVHAWAPAKTFHHVEPELAAIVNSFALR